MADPEENPETPADDAQAADADAPAEADADFKYIVRIANTDLDGNKAVHLALTGIKGIGDRVATVVTEQSGVDRSGKIGDLSDDDVAKLADAVSKIPDIVPDWMVNRRHDIDTGDDLHLLRTDLEQQLREDLNRLKKIRSYRGVRHETGQKVRGQRSRANGRSGLAMGVSRSKEQ